MNIALSLKTLALVAFVAASTAAIVQAMAHNSAILGI